MYAGTYSFLFESADWLYSSITEMFTNLIVIETGNFYSPILNNGKVYPPKGYKNPSEALS